MGTFNLLFVADICGKPGRQAAAHMIKPLREKYEIDCVVANIENSAGGFGITPEMSRKMFSYGINVQTSGNHMWDRVDILEYIQDEPRLIRAANYPPAVPGNGSYLAQVGSVQVGVVSLMGRVYMANLDCPFQIGMREVKKLQKHTNIIFVDFHAEATSEKQALAYYLDGHVSAVIGTHTHVQTADDSISKRGTAYLTDAGMTGPHDSIIGMDKGPSLGRFLTGMPKRFTTASEDVRISGVIIRIDPVEGRALEMERFCLPFDIQEYQGGKSLETE